MRYIFAFSCLIGFAFPKTIVANPDIVISKFSMYNLGETERYTIKPANEFRIPVNRNEDLYYLSVNLFGDHKDYEKRSKNIFSFLVESDDNVSLEMDSCGISCGLKFSGKNSPKYECISKIQAIPSKPKQVFINGKVKPITDYDDPYVRLVNSNNELDSLFALKLAVLESYKPKISSNAYTVLKADIWGQLNWIKYAEIDFEMFLAFSNIPDKQQRVRKYYEDHLEHQSYDTTNSDLLAFSKWYSRCLLTKQKVGLQMKVGKRSTLGTVITIVQSNFTGVLREKLLTDLISSGFQVNDSSFFFLSKIKPLVKKEVFISKLNDLERKTPGVPFYNFTLTDMQGRRVTLETLKGKVVVLDFWYTGCPGCRALTPYLKEVKDYFKDSSNVAFMSLSSDSDKTTWKKSVLSGAYGDPEDINVWIGTKFGHPLLRYYGIEGYPTLLILDKDSRFFRQITSYQRPMDKQTVKDFIDLIKKAG